MKNPILPQQIDIYYQDHVDGKFFDGQHYSKISEEVILRSLKFNKGSWREIIKRLENSYGIIEKEFESGEFTTSWQDYGTLQGKKITRTYIIDINNLDPEMQMTFKKELKKLKKKNPELIPGGLAEGRKPEEFDQRELAKGIKVEMEHTPDPDVAREIAMDHLVEDPKYYVKLAKIEKNPSALVKSKSDEVKWRKAKKDVAASRGKKQDKFTKRDWGLVTKIYKSQNPSGESEAVKTFRYWLRDKYLTPKQRAVCERLIPHLQYYFDFELFATNVGSYEREEDDLLHQEPEKIVIVFDTFEDTSVGIFGARVFEITVNPNGNVIIFQGSGYMDFLDSLKEDDQKLAAEFEDSLITLKKSLEG